MIRRNSFQVYISQSLRDKRAIAIVTKVAQSSGIDFEYFVLIHSQNPDYSFFKYSFALRAAFQKKSSAILKELELSVIVPLQAALDRYTDKFYEDEQHDKFWRDHRFEPRLVPRATLWGYVWDKPMRDLLTRIGRETRSKQLSGFVDSLMKLPVPTFTETKEIEGH